MNRYTAILTAGALAAGIAGAAAPQPARAQGAYCPAPVTIFGTIQRRTGGTMVVRRNDGQWARVNLTPGANVATNGYGLQPGMHVAAYGCITPNGIFHASQVSLSNRQFSYSETLRGRVQRVYPNRLIVWEPGRRTSGTWVLGGAERFRPGQWVIATGTESAAGYFYPNSIQ